VADQRDRQSAALTTTQDRSELRRLADRTRHWGLSHERPNDVLLEDGSGRLILRGFAAPKGSWSGWPPPWYAKDAVAAVHALPALLDALDSRDVRIGSLEAALRRIADPQAEWYDPRNSRLGSIRAGARAALGGSDDAR